MKSQESYAQKYWPHYPCISHLTDPFIELISPDHDRIQDVSWQNCHTEAEFAYFSFGQVGPALNIGLR